jgi:hypothetical protein
MAMTPEEQAIFDKMKADLDAALPALAKVPELTKTIEALTTQKTELEKKNADLDNQAQTISLKTEFPELDLNLLPTGVPFEKKREAAVALMTWKTGKAPSTDKGGNPPPPAPPEKKKEGEEWTKAGYLSPSGDAAQIERAQKEQKVVEEAVAKGDVMALAQHAVMRMKRVMPQLFAERK